MHGNLLLSENTQSTHEITLLMYNFADHIMNIFRQNCITFLVSKISTISSFFGHSMKMITDLLVSATIVILMHC